MKGILVKVDSKGEEGVRLEGKRTEKEKVKEVVKRMIEEAAKNKKFGVTCEICKVINIWIYFLSVRSYYRLNWNSSTLGLFPFNYTVLLHSAIVFIRPFV